MIRFNVWTQRVMEDVLSTLSQGGYNFRVVWLRDHWNVEVSNGRAELTARLNAWAPYVEWEKPMVGPQ